MEDLVKDKNQQKHFKTRLTDDGFAWKWIWFEKGIERVQLVTDETTYRDHVDKSAEQDGAIKIEQVTAEQIYASLSEQQEVVKKYDSLVALYEQTRALVAGALFIFVYAIYYILYRYVAIRKQPTSAEWFAIGTALLASAFVMLAMLYLADRTGRDAARELAVQYIKRFCCKV